MVRKCVGTENLTEYDENCWHLMKWHNGKFDIQTGCWSRVRKEQSGLSTVRSDFTSKLVHELAFGTTKFCIAPKARFHVTVITQINKSVVFFYRKPQCKILVFRMLIRILSTT